MRKKHLMMVVIFTAAVSLFVTGAVFADETFSIEEHSVASGEALLCNVQPEPNKEILWFIESNANRLGRLDLKSGEVLKFDMPEKVEAPFAGSILPYPGALIGPCDMTFAPDGILWFNHQGANGIGYIDPEPPYAIHEIELPTKGSIPMSLATGADGNIYVTLTGADKIARINPATRQITEFTVPTAGSGIIGGTAAKKDGAHWFVLMTANKLLRFDYETHEMKEFVIPTPVSGPFVIRAYDDGLWYTLFSANAIGHFNPETEEFSKIDIPTLASSPIGVIKGADGDLYSNLSTGDMIARIDRSSREVVAEYPLPSKGTFPTEVKMGPDGAIWVTEYLSGNLARLWVNSFGKDPGFPQKSDSVDGGTSLLDDAIHQIGLDE